MTTAQITAPVQAEPAGRRHHVWLLVAAVVVALAALPAVVDGSLLAMVVVAAGAVALALAAGVYVTHRHRAHDRAQEATRDALETAAAADSLHGWVEDLDVPGGRVGHVVLNPAGAFVVASSWHGLGVSHQTIQHETTSAAAAADRTRAVVRAHGVAAGVRPVVAVWGAGQVDVPAGGTEIAEVLFIRGSELAEFLRWSAVFGGAWSYAEATDCLLDLRDIPAAGRVLAGAR